MKKLLGVFAHPDDESILCGGTLAKYAATGWQVDIVTATRGEAGGWGSVPNVTGGKVSEVREKELAHAAEILGISSVTFLDFLDGKLTKASPGQVEDSLVKVFTTMRPDVVITHTTDGFSHHPDHIKISRSATFSFQTYARDRKEENADDTNPPKLYYATFPTSTLSYLIENKLFPGEKFDQPYRGMDDKKITTVINIDKTKVVKMKALFAHETQRPELEKYMDIPKNPFFRQEYFVLRMVGFEEAFMGKNDRVSDRL